MKIWFFGLVVIAIAATAVPPASAKLAASPWPMFGHDLQHTGQSYYRGPETPILAWSYRTNRIVDSSAALGVDGRVYVGSRDNVFYAFNPNGALAWSFTTGQEIPVSPAIDDAGRMYFGSFDGRSYCVGSSGSLVWSYANGGIFSAPALGPDGIVYTGGSFTDHNFYALTAVGGTLIWSYRTGGMTSSSPAYGNDGRMYGGSLDANLYAITPAGTLAWSYRTDHFILTAAIDAAGRIYIGSGDNNIYAFDSKGSLSWSFVTGSFLSASPALSMKGAIHIGSEDGNYYSLSPSGALIWSYRSGDEILSSVTIGVDGRLYAGSTDNNVYALNSNGTFLWSYLTPFSIWSSPAIGSDGRIYAGANDNNLYAFAGPPPNYINLSVMPAPVIPGDKVTFGYSCDFGTWDYEGDPVDIYLAAIKDPVVGDAPSTVGDALGGGTVYLFGPRMVPYRYTGAVQGPTFSSLSFPPLPTSGSVSIRVPAVAGLKGNYVFAAAFIRHGAGSFVRTDGLPVENSNIFVIQ